MLACVSFNLHLFIIVVLLVLLAFVCPCLIARDCFVLSARAAAWPVRLSLKHLAVDSVHVSLVLLICANC